MSLAVILIVMLYTFYIPSSAAQNTIYIKPDGSVEPSTTLIQRNGDVYTLESNVSDFIEVQKSNIVIDGNGHTLQGNGTGRAIQFSNMNNVTIKNIKIAGYSAGIYAGYSTNSKVINNSITNCTYGILPDFSPDTTIINNTITNNKWDGIFAIGSPNSTITNNTVTDNDKWGIYLGDSGGSTLRRNVMSGNRFNFGVSGSFALDADTSNTVDGKPTYFWINQRDKQVPSDAGFVAIVNSENIIIRNLNLNKNGYGVVIANSANSVIENLNATDHGYYGIYLINSNFNTIRNNSIARNQWGGMALVTSTGNIVSNNTIEDLDKGILIHESNSNTISGNILRSNDEGPYLFTSSDNLIVNNIIENNNVGMYLYDSSNNNHIHHNNFVNNRLQIYIRNSVSKWDDGYPSGGNYWSDYNGTDTDGDDIGDTPYIINNANRDNYPLMHAVQKPWIQPYTISDPLTTFSRATTILIVAALAYFLKGIRKRTPRHQQAVKLFIGGSQDI